MSKKIVFKINKNGDVAIDEMTGYASGCVDASAALEKRLGQADESSRRLTEEYNEPLSLDNEEHISH
jgi:hypothetical protein